MLHITFLRDECQLLANFTELEVVISGSDDASVLKVHKNIHLVETIARYVSFPKLIKFILLESAEANRE